MMAGKNQAALAVCAQTKVIFPFNWTQILEFLQHICHHCQRFNTSKNIVSKIKSSLIELKMTAEQLFKTHMTVLVPKRSSELHK